MTRYTDALWMPNANCFAGRNGLIPRYVILHATAGGASAQNIATYFKSTEGTTNQVSANYVDGQDGTIVCCNDENDGAWANGYLSNGYDSWWSPSVNPNNITISIEIVKSDLNNANAPTTAQFASLIKLVNDICNRWGIPKRWADANGGITGHFSVDPVNRQNCPGNFDWNTFFAALNTSQPAQGGSTNMTTVPTGWKDSNNILTAPNGIQVRDGFRTYILTHAWESGNIPLEPAHGLNPLELSNTSLGSGTRQTFRWITLEWTSKGGVFESWVGAELIATLTLLRSVQSKYQALGDAWNKIVTEKDGLVAENTSLNAIVSQLNVTISHLNAEIAQLKANPAGNTEQLQQQINVLTAQVTGMTNKLAQIDVILKAS